MNVFIGSAIVVLSENGESLSKTMQGIWTWYSEKLQDVTRNYKLQEVIPWDYAYVCKWSLGSLKNLLYFLPRPFETTNLLSFIEVQPRNPLKE